MNLILFILALNFKKWILLRRHRFESSSSLAGTGVEVETTGTGVDVETTGTVVEEEPIGVVVTPGVVVGKGCVVVIGWVVVIRVVDEVEFWVGFNFT